MRLVRVDTYQTLCGINPSVELEKHPKPKSKFQMIFKSIRKGNMHESGWDNTPYATLLDDILHVSVQVYEGGGVLQFYYHQIMHSDINSDV